MPRAVNLGRTSCQQIKPKLSCQGHSLLDITLASLDVGKWINEIRRTTGLIVNASNIAMKSQFWSAPNMGTRNPSSLLRIGKARGPIVRTSDHSQQRML